MRMRTKGAAADDGREKGGGENIHVAHVSNVPPVVKNISRARTRSAAANGHKDQKGQRVRRPEGQKGQRSEGSAV